MVRASIGGRSCGWWSSVLARWLIGGGWKMWAGRMCHRFLREQNGTVVHHPSVDGRERQDEHGLVGQGVTEELI